MLSRVVLVLNQRKCLATNFAEIRQVGFLPIPRLVRGFIALEHRTLSACFVPDYSNNFATFHTTFAFPAYQFGVRTVLARFLVDLARSLILVPRD
ncbi:hypothetical protein MSAN_00423000 [Mycena sanguinolenta]|uniref:Uncharacterized protein n=1 Tax=Mycena sanguinolenta TaxID=230812 RepID=A0A8H7DJA7_9AGAR|nr:hypothetical protein MSAN_00423000 [Mycena sanguinolenta]